jgi:hypothetical protein
MVFPEEAMFRTVVQADAAAAKPSFAFAVPNLKVKAEVRDIHVDERAVMEQRIKRIKCGIFMMVGPKAEDLLF